MLIRRGAALVAFVSAALLLYGCQHDTSLSNHLNFEVGLIADHIQVFWTADTSWSSLSHLAFTRRPYSCAWPMLFSGMIDPTGRWSRFAIPLWWVFFASCALWVGLAVLAVRRVVGERERTPPERVQE